MTCDMIGVKRKPGDAVFSPVVCICTVCTCPLSIYLPTHALCSSPALVPMLISLPLARCPVLAPLMPASRPALLRGAVAWESLICLLTCVGPVPHTKAGRHCQAGISLLALSTRPSVRRARNANRMAECIVSRGDGRHDGPKHRMRSVRRFDRCVRGNLYGSREWNADDDNNHHHSDPRRTLLQADSLAFVTRRSTQAAALPSRQSACPLSCRIRFPQSQTYQRKCGTHYCDLFFWCKSSRSKIASHASKIRLPAAHMH